MNIYIYTNTKQLDLWRADSVINLNKIQSSSNVFTFLEDIISENFKTFGPVQYLLSSRNSHPILNSDLHYNK